MEYVNSLSAYEFDLWKLCFLANLNMCRGIISCEMNEYTTQKKHIISLAEPKILFLYIIIVSKQIFRCFSTSK